MKYGFTIWSILAVMVLSTVAATWLTITLERQKSGAVLAACEETRHGLEDAAEMARTHVKTSAATIAQREQDITALQEELQALRVQAAAWARRARDADDTARPLPKFSRW